MSDHPRLTERQRQILETIREFCDETGYPPTLRQIGEVVGISSTSVVSYNLDVLQRKGFLMRDPDVSRGLKLIDETLDDQGGSENVTMVPLLGFIAAGEPLPIPDADYENQELVPVPEELVGDANQVYALRVRGISMIDALINDGDLVLMQYQQNAENGDMVAAWLNDEKATTLKQIFWDKGTNLVRLQPANPNMAPIYVHPANLQIQGRLIGVIRRI